MSINAKVTASGGLKGGVSRPSVTYRDGFSPTVEVAEDDESTYVLKITTKDGSFLTPNLKANADVQAIELDYIDSLFD